MVPLVNSAFLLRPARRAGNGEHCIAGGAIAIEIEVVPLATLTPIVAPKAAALP